MERVRRLPWGVGACFRQTSGGRSQGSTWGLLRDPDPADGRHRRRLPLLALRGGWRAGELVDGDLEILRRIDPAGGELVEPVEGSISTLPGRGPPPASSPSTTSEPTCGRVRNRSARGSAGRWSSSAIRTWPSRSAATSSRRPMLPSRSSAAQRSGGPCAKSRIASKVPRSPATLRPRRSFNSSTTSASARSIPRPCRRRSKPTTSASSAGWRCCRRMGEITGT